MEAKKIIFKDEESGEVILTMGNPVEIFGFLQTFRLETEEVIELKDAMYTVKNISKSDDKQEVFTVEVEYIDLIENQPTA